MQNNGQRPDPLMPLSAMERGVNAEAQDAMRKAVEEVMDIESIMTGPAENPVEIRGRLHMPADQAFDILRPRFEAVDHTPRLQEEDGQHIVRALPVVFSRQEHKIPTTNIILLIVTIVSVFLVGVQQGDGIYDGVLMLFLARLTGNTDLLNYPHLMPTDEVWRQALMTGVYYMLALLGILGTHEMGHYLMARRYKVNTTWPFFIPLPPPIGILGTLGAVIAMREPAPNRRVQFDIGVAGPIAGLIVTIPVLLLGLSLSEVATTSDILNSLPPEIPHGVIHEGQSLTYLALKYIIFGEVLPSGGRDVWIHPVAFAGWAGLLVTALNLIPIGQLDGGHVVYGLFGKNAQKARQPIIIALIVLASFGVIKELALQLPDGPTFITSMIHFLASLPVPGWSGWWIWILLLTFLVRGHAPVLDEITDLGPGRKALGVAMIVIFVLIFTPVPLVIEAEPIAMLWHLFV